MRRRDRSAEDAVRERVNAAFDREDFAAALREIRAVSTDDRANFAEDEAYALLQLGDIEGGIAVIDRAVHGADRPQLLILAALDCARHGRSDRARELMEHATSLDPSVFESMLGHPELEQLVLDRALKGEEPHSSEPSSTFG